MNRANETIWPGVIFLSTWWALAEYTPFGGYSFFIAILFWLVGLAVIKFLGRAHFRLGPRAWLLTGQLAVWFGLFLYFVPAVLPIKILILWGIGVPLIFVGAAARFLNERFPKLKNGFHAVPKFYGALLLILLPVLSWGRGAEFWSTVAWEFGSCAMAAVPVYYGWRLAQPLPRGERDARFGSEDDYRAGGMFSER